MRGTIQKRGSESWRIKACVGRDASGKKRYVSRTVRGPAAGCRAGAVPAARRDRRGTLYVASAPMSLNELLDRWLEAVREFGSLRAR
jgi:hypothetical protein